jgi:hypothetical protein
VRAICACLVLVLLGTLASADEKALRAYDGQIVISPDPAPANIDELHAYLKANATKDRHYELIKGPPWEINLVGMLAKDPGTSPVSLVFWDAADKQRTPVQSIEVPSKRRVVIARTTATTAAGFELEKTYVVELRLGKLSLAKATLKLRP